MKLDDRPVIDQLLNPTPLNILADVLMAHIEAQRLAPSEKERDWATASLNDFARDLEGRL